jgi:hypothetical protein
MVVCKMLARRALIIVGLAGMIGITLAVTHEAAGAAVSVGSYALIR